MLRIYQSVFAAVVKSPSSAMHRSRASRQKDRVFATASAAVQRKLRGALCVALGVSLLITSTPASAQTIVGVVAESKASFAFWLRANGLPAKLYREFTGQESRPQPEEKQRDRDAQVIRLQIYPGDVTINVGERVAFAAVAYDQQGASVGGTKINWSVEDTGRVHVSHITAHGAFEPETPGVYRITAAGAGQTAQVKVVVRPVPGRGNGKGPMNHGRPVSTRDLPAGSTSKNRKPAGEQAALASKLEVKSQGRKAQSQRAHARLVTPTPIADENGWDDTNYTSADDPGNLPGNPPGGAMDGGAGNGNFQIAAPVLGLPGRGIDISLGLAYNSRLWNKAGNQITYDIDRGWPAPGWSLGFGKMLQMGTQGAMLIDADGTRHPYAGIIHDWGYAVYFEGHTTDGTLIDYTSLTYTGNQVFGGQARLPNGTTIYYGTSGTGAAYPTSVNDANGNIIVISYPNNIGPRIETITDTLGRNVIFSYNSNNLLTAITAPGLSGGSRTLVRLHYRQLSLGYSFSGSMTTVVQDPAPWVVDAIYYPGTSTGYWFGDSDSYSTYGMIAKVSERRNMTYSPPSLTDQGTISSGEAGQVTREEVYNYPLTTGSPGGSGLTDAPTYTSCTESWTRDGSNFDSATTGYEIHETSSPRTVTITLPNGTTSKQYSYNSPGSFLDGLVYLDETRNAAGTVLQSSGATWALGAYDSPRPTQVQATNERSQTTTTQFSYGGVYNQVTDVRNYDYGGGLLRSTRTQYQNSTNYTNLHIFNLPLLVEIYGADNLTRVSRTEYQYDGQTLTNTPDVVGHSDAYNPYAPEYLHSPGTCCEWDYWQINCVTYCPDYWASDYDPATDYRGNVTQVTTYADALTPSVPITETRRYDITGNLVTASTACCQQTSFTYTLDTQYAYPQVQTRGSATDSYTQVSSSATYDFNTGLTMSATDSNGRTSQTSYFAATLRPQTTTVSTGAHTDYAYDDAAMSVTQTSYLAPTPADTGAVADQNIKLLNGRGQVRQEKALGANSVWDLVDTIYDSMGRVSQQSRPYRSGDTPLLISVAYDALGRTTRMTAPDSSVSETYYNEIDFDLNDGYSPTRPNVVSASAPGETTLVRDAWGRERWGRTDAQGRLVEVVEPNPSGNGSVATGGLVTTYSYNTLGNLTGVAQGAQTRSFKYDSLGRLLAQKLAETSATLNDAGAYQTSGGTWSDVFTYDDRSNLTSRTDARGVKTVYGYNNDPLNRLQSISWDTSGFGDSANPVLAAASVTYAYRTKDSPTQLRDVTQSSSVTTNGISSESYSYDSEGRVGSKTLTLTSRSSYPFVTDYIFDTLDRITDVRYPAEYGNGSQPRKLVHQDYDVASRLSSLTVDGQQQASSVVYNAASQTTSLSVGATGANQMLEGYSYDAQTGLLAGQTAARSSTPSNPILNLSYDYTNANGKRTGQLTKLLNNLNHNRDRGYAYDALGRLKQATGGPASAPLWTQTYSYDPYGNRTSVSSSGYSARNGSTPPGSAGVPPAAMAQTGPGADRNPQRSSPLGMVEATAPRDSSTNLSLSDSASNSLTLTAQSVKSHHASRSARTTPANPQGGPPVFTDDPLVPGVTVIKAVHITELRTAVNQARSRAGLAAANWAEAVAAGVLVKAAHIVELRARLDEARAALGLPAANYTDPTLTVGVTTVKAVHIQELRQRVTEALAGYLSSIPTDGIATLAFNVATNRITTAGFDYDKAGNQVRALAPGGGSQRFQYDAANRLVKVKADDNVTVLATYTYGDSNERLIADAGGQRTYYACNASTEYVESGGSTTPQWSKTYIYLGARLLSTLTPNGSGGEFVQYHHPDRLGTRLVTNAQDTTYFEQVTLPFGTALNAESTGSTNRRFTSYDRSAATGLDYAVNRHYDSQQGRFTQVDPIGMRSVSLSSPQTLNLYAYCTNDPINHTDPSGLGFFSFLKKIFKGIGKLLTNKWVLLVVGIAAGIASGFAFYWAIKEAGGALVGFFIKAGIILAGTSAALIASAFHPNIQRYAQFIGGIVSSAQSIIGLLNPRVFGTPPWNPEAGGGVGAVSNFMAVQRRRRARDHVQELLDQIQRLRDRLGSRYNDFIDTINNNKNSNISTEVVLCQGSQESSFLNLEATDSGFTESTVGHQGEIGMLQIKPTTASSLGVDPSGLTDVATNVTTGTGYLTGLLNQNGGSLRTALGKYKGGSGPLTAAASRRYADQILQCSKQVRY
jgi:RHS repeat-associated protein